MKNIYKMMIVLGICVAAYGQTNSYTQTPLVSDVPGQAPNTDAHLINPWGLSRSASSYWWVSDEGSGVSTLYNGTGAVQSLVVTIPSANHTSPGSPTGTVAVGKSFVFVTLDGTISQWTTGTRAVMKVNNASKGASYTGCTLSKIGSTNVILVANSSGGVEAYSTSFAPVTLPPTAFTDPSLPAGYTPYGIQAIGSNVWVTFSSATGVGGFVDKFTSSGSLLLQLTGGALSEPWGVAQGPASGFGKFSKTILVGNVGSGLISAFNPTTGAFLGNLQDASHHNITLPGLWAIYFGGGSPLNGSTTTLYYATGTANYDHGFFGSITAN